MFKGKLKKIDPNEENNKAEQIQVVSASCIYLKTLFLYFDHESYFKLPFFIESENSLNFLLKSSLNLFLVNQRWCGRETVCESNGSGWL